MARYSGKIWLLVYLCPFISALVIQNGIHRLEAKTNGEFLLRTGLDQFTIKLLYLKELTSDDKTVNVSGAVRKVDLSSLTFTISNVTVDHPTYKTFTVSSPVQIGKMIAMLTVVLKNFILPGEVKKIPFGNTATQIGTTEIKIHLQNWTFCQKNCSVGTKNVDGAFLDMGIALSGVQGEITDENGDFSFYNGKLAYSTYINVNADLKQMFTGYPKIAKEVNQDIVILRFERPISFLSSFIYSHFVCDVFGVTKPPLEGQNSPYLLKTAIASTRGEVFKSINGPAPSGNSVSYQTVCVAVLETDHPVKAQNANDHTPYLREASDQSPTAIAFPEVLVTTDLPVSTASLVDNSDYSTHSLDPSKVQLVKESVSFDDPAIKPDSYLPLSTSFIDITDFPIQSLIPSNIIRMEPTTSLDKATLTEGDEGSLETIASNLDTFSLSRRAGRPNSTPSSTLESWSYSSWTGVPELTSSKPTTKPNAPNSLDSSRSSLVAHQTKGLESSVAQILDTPGLTKNTEESKATISLDSSRSSLVAHQTKGLESSVAQILDTWGVTKKTEESKATISLGSSRLSLVVNQSKTEGLESSVADTFDAGVFSKKTEEARASISFESDTLDFPATAESQQISLTSEGGKYTSILKETKPSRHSSLDRASFSKNTWQGVPFSTKYASEVVTRGYTPELSSKAASIVMHSFTDALKKTEMQLTTTPHTTLASTQEPSNPISFFTTRLHGWLHGYPTTALVKCYITTVEVASLFSNQTLLSSSQLVLTNRSLGAYGPYLNASSTLFPSRVQCAGNAKGLAVPCETAEVASLSSNQTLLSPSQSVLANLSLATYFPHLNASSTRFPSRVPCAGISGAKGLAVPVPLSTALSTVTTISIAVPFILLLVFSDFRPCLVHTIIASRA